MTSVPLLDLHAQNEPLLNEIRAAVDRVIRSQRFILGPEVEALEAEVAEYCRSPFAIGASSGTDALVMALLAAGVGPGDDVIVPAFTFFATAGTVARVGARPVFADIEPGTFNIDPLWIERVWTLRTKAVIPVHLFGQMADMTMIERIAGSRHATVIEDAAQAIGAFRDGASAGSTAALGCLSFYPTKNLGALGDAGMVLARDAATAGVLRSLRDHGFERRYFNKRIGGNFRLDAIQAAALRVKLPYLDRWSNARNANARRYRTLFEQFGLLGKVRLPAEVPDGRHIYNQFVIRVDRRDALMEHLKSQGIGCEIYYPVPLHLQECFAHLGYVPGDFPESERAAAEVLALPIYAELTDEMLIRVVSTIAAFR